MSVHERARLTRRTHLGVRGIGVSLAALVPALWALGACRGPEATSPAKVVIELAPGDAANLKEGHVVQLRVRALSATGDFSDAPVTWRLTGDTTFAEMLSPGQFSLKREGNVVIVARVGDIESDAFTLPVAEGLRIAGPDGNRAPIIRMPVSYPATLQLSAANTEGPVTWSSSNTAIATIDGNGLITPVDLGDATITLTSGQAKAYAYITVVPPQADSVWVAPSPVTVIHTQQTTLTATPKMGSGSNIDPRFVTFTWTSSNASVATVSGNGPTATVTGVSPSTTPVTISVTAQIGNYPPKKTDVTVTVIPVPVSHVHLTYNSSKIPPGATAVPTLDLRDVNGNILSAAGRNITFSGDNPGITVDPSTGVVTGSAPGVVTVTATVQNVGPTPPVPSQTERDSASVLVTGWGRIYTNKSGIVSNFRGVWAASPTEAYLPANNGRVVWYNGRFPFPYDSILVPSGLSSTPAGLNQVWGPGPGQVFASGNGGLIVRCINRVCTNQTHPFSGIQPTWRGIFGFSATDVLVTGGGTPGDVVRFDGTNWNAMPNPNGNTNLFLDCVWGASATDLWVCAAESTLFHWNGSAWTKVVSPPLPFHNTNLDFHAMWGSSSSDIFVVGDNGTILHTTNGGTSWTQQASGTTATLHGIHGRAANDIYIVGDGGTLLHYNGSSWSPVSGFSSTANLWGVFALPNAPDVYVSGDFTANQTVLYRFQQ